MPAAAPPVRVASRVRALVAIALVASLPACSAGPTLPEGELYKEASLALEGESYASAISSYKKLLEEYPFSDKAEIASINIAYAHYLNNEYNEAIAAFNDFERLYPVSPLLPFVSYTIGICWLDQSRDGQRDASPSDEALRQFRKVENEFPHTLYADMAVFRQQQARENLAAHEIAVGDYYKKRKRYEAAASRYRFAVTEYPTTENAVRAASLLKEIDTLVASAKPEKPSVNEKASSTEPAAAPADVVNPTTGSGSPASASGPGPGPATGAPANAERSAF